MSRPRLGMSLLAALGALAALGTAAPASADVLYVAPDGTENPYGCTDPQEPCEIGYAIDQSQRGDEVIVAPGDYKLDGGLFIDLDRYVHGADGQRRPRLILSGHVVVNAGAQLWHLALESSGPQALFLRGSWPWGPGPSPYPDAYPAVGEDLLVSATGSAGAERVAYGTASVEAGAVLRDSVVTASGEGTSAVLTTAGRADLRNVTAIATGLNSVGIHVTNVRCTPAPFNRCYSSCSTTGEIVAKNSIARGTFADIRATANCDDPATLGISYSNFRAGSVSDSAGTITIEEGNQTSVDPLFVNASEGDFHQMPTSLTIDAGTRDPLLGATDIDGQARRLGLGPDIGADEAPDADADGHPDGADNCRKSRNKSQADRDRDGKGDACDPLANGRCANLFLGTAADDHLSGTAEGDRIKGLGGDDSLEGRAGRDCLAGGGGVNTYRAGRGNDRVVASNRTKELIECGRGKDDRAIVDENDIVAGCEHVKRK